MSKELLQSISRQISTLEKDKELYVNMVDKEIQKLKQKVAEITTPCLINTDNL